METKELKEQRGRILSKLGKIIELAESIKGEMKSVPHQGGVAYRSLKPKSRMYVVESSMGFTARYQHTDGKWYDISINQMKK